jgi:protein arginine N-methyltransferase 7
MSRPTQAEDVLAANPGALTKIGCALMGSGQGAKAVALARQALARRPDDPELLSAVQVILSHAIPQWHGAMLLDTERNAAFEHAIVRAVASGRSLLDIGTGSGLLSMMAARAGSKAVYACEANPALAETAREIFERNGFGDLIRTLPKHSTGVDRDSELGGGADVVVAEIFSDDLLNEGALATLRHAHSALARPNAQFIPAAASIRFALAHYEMSPPELTGVEGFDLSLFKRHLNPETKVAIGDKRLQLRGEPETLFHFDFASGSSFAGERSETRVTVSRGSANGIARWIKLVLDDVETYENEPGPGRRSHWAGLFTPFPDGVLEDGQSVTVHAAHDQERVHIWFS